MDVTKKDSEFHSLLSQLFNQHATWNGMPTQNIGALDQAFSWFNEIGKRIEEGLKAQEAQAETKKENKKAS